MTVIVLTPTESGGYIGGRGSELRYTIERTKEGYAAADLYLHRAIGWWPELESARAAIEKRARRPVRLGK